jgi:uncharacterized protein (DUF302 family)
MQEDVRAQGVFERDKPCNFLPILVSQLLELSAKSPDDGMVHLNSPYPVAESVNRVMKQITQRGLTLFAHIDFSKDAQAAGLEMPASQLLIFGNPKSGTPVMVLAPTAALDLPLKALIWEDEEGTVRISFNSSEYVQRRHSVPDSVIKNIGALPLILQEALV